MTGIVQQTDNRYTLLDLGKVEALLPQAEQVSYERYEHGARLKAYIVEVRKTTKGPQIVVSRSHPGLIKRLFELEVPEISSGAVEIKAAAREPGHRTKIAVWSNDPNVDPVGACVGARGSRVRMVTNELRGERVDVVPFSDDPVELIQSALAPARVREVRLDDETGTATVIVSDYQLSLAIGKEGQNARLAARLTGWRIDIKSETQLAEEESGYAGEEWAEGEWVQNEAGEMVWQPAEGGTAVSATRVVPGSRGRRGRCGPGGRRCGGDAPPSGPVTGEAPPRRPSRAERGRRGRAPAWPQPMRRRPSRRSRGGGSGIVAGPDLRRVPADRHRRTAGPGGPHRGRVVGDRAAPARTGGWLCRDSPACLERRSGGRAFDRALRGPSGETTRSPSCGARWLDRREDGGTGLGGSGAVMCEDRGSYVRVGI